MGARRVRLENGAGAARSALHTFGEGAPPELFAQGCGVRPLRDWFASTFLKDADRLRPRGLGEGIMSPGLEGREVQPVEKDFHGVSDPQLATVGAQAPYLGSFLCTRSCFVCVCVTSVRLLGLWSARC